MSSLRESGRGWAIYAATEMDGCGDQKGKKVGRFFDFSTRGTEKAKVEALIF
jgi:hypothetical protein